MYTEKMLKLPQKHNANSKTDSQFNNSETHLHGNLKIKVLNGKRTRLAIAKLCSSKYVNLKVNFFCQFIEQNKQPILTPSLAQRQKKSSASI